MEFLSPYENIYESTHAHYDRTMYTCGFVALCVRILLQEPIRLKVLWVDA